MSTTLRVVHGTLQYVEFAVSLTDAQGAAVDPTGDAVAVAVRPWQDLSTALSYQAATWVTDTSGAAPVYYARILVGQAPFDLAPGLYRVYVRVTDTPEHPVLDDWLLYVAAG